MSVLLLNVEDNTAPNIVLTLQRNGTVIDVTGATVSLIIAKRDDGSITNTGHQTCTVTDGENGLVTYTPQAADFADPGRYYCEVKIDYVGGKVERMYEVLSVLVREKVA